MKVFLWMLPLLLAVGGGTWAQTVPAPAEASPALDWPACVRSALSNNPNLASARQSVRGAEVGIVISRSGLLPQVGGSAGWGHGDSEGAGSDSYSYGANASQLLYDGGQRWNDLSQARQSLESAKIDYEQASMGVRRELRRSYISLLKAQQLIRISHAILERRDQTTRMIRLRYEGGREHKGALLAAEARLADATLNVSRAERALELARCELATRLGVGRAGSLSASGEFVMPVLPTNPMLDEAVTALSSVRKQDIAARSSELSAQSARADYLPSINASAGMSRRGGEWPPTDDEWSVGVSMSIALFDSGQRWGSVRKALAVRQAAYDQQRAARNEGLTMLQTAWIQFQDAVGSVAVSAKYFEASAERAKIGGAQYSSGLLSFDNWIIIEDDFAGAERQYVEAQAAAMTAEAEWIHAKGGSLENEEK